MKAWKPWTKPDSVEFSNNNVNASLGPEIQPEGQMSLVWPGGLLTGCLMKEMVEYLSQCRYPVMCLLCPTLPQASEFRACSV